ncbi:hypothetical protein QJS66_17645 [Kocuria rhizophila]|nr:hypothetical protein QJS66_17645 [Kocuria rhizophila]
MDRQLQRDSELSGSELRGPGPALGVGHRRAALPRAAAQCSAGSARGCPHALRMSAADVRRSPTPPMPAAWWWGLPSTGAAPSPARPRPHRHGPGHLRGPAGPRTSTALLGHRPQGGSPSGGVKLA